MKFPHRNNYTPIGRTDHAEGTLAAIKFVSRSHDTAGWNFAECGSVAQQSRSRRIYGEKKRTPLSGS
jgi:hypothetical protein